MKRNLPLALHTLTPDKTALTDSPSQAVHDRRTSDIADGSQQ